MEQNMLLNAYRLQYPCGINLVVRTENGSIVSAFWIISMSAKQAVIIPQSVENLDISVEIAILKSLGLSGSLHRTGALPVGVQQQILQRAA